MLDFLVFQHPGDGGDFSEPVVQPSFGRRPFRMKLCQLRLRATAFLFLFTGEALRAFDLQPVSLLRFCKAPLDGLQLGGQPFLFDLAAVQFVLKISDELCPPKPSEFVIAYAKSTSRAVFGT